jgi:putative transposase
LLGLPRSTLYYQPASLDAADDPLRREIDAIFTRFPFYGVPRMTVELRRRGHEVGRKRVRRLMREMGLEAIYPRPRTSRPHPEHRIYPYLLRGLDVNRPNQVWCSDITYIRLRRGFVYLAAVMDWFSRYVLGWEVSISLETAFCLEALETALRRGRPEIFNTDQGSQFTSQAFTGRLEAARIAISMDGRGRCFDNIFVERLWRSVKYEEVYLHDYADVRDARRGLGNYFELYNGVRLHQSLDYQTPERVHFNGIVAAHG